MSLFVCVDSRLPQHTRTGHGTTYKRSSPLLPCGFQGPNSGCRPVEHIYLLGPLTAPTLLETQDSSNIKTILTLSDGPTFQKGLDKMAPFWCVQRVMEGLGWGTAGKEMGSGTDRKSQAAAARHPSVICCAQWTWTADVHQTPGLREGGFQ